MASKQYFDDPDEGLARDTSHPRFVALAPDEFYYDCADDFSPFGNDDGADTLIGLEDWYRDGGKDDEIGDYLADLLEEWDFGMPDGLVGADPATVEAWLAKDSMNDRYLHSHCAARIATAFGQLKITGKVNPEMRDEGLAGIDCQLWLNERARLTHPDWVHADAERERLNAMRAVLAAV